MYPMSKNKKRKGAKQSSPVLESPGSPATSPPTKTSQSRSTQKKLSSTKSSPPTSSPTKPSPAKSSANFAATSSSATKLQSNRKLLASQQFTLEQNNARNATNSKESTTKTVNTKPSPQPKRFRSPDERQIHRFYEPLVLLFTLGRTRADRTPEDPRMDMTSLSIRDARRKFLKALAYAYDYEKGGDTVTAIGLEQTPEANVF